MNINIVTPFWPTCGSRTCWALIVGVLLSESAGGMRATTPPSTMDLPHGVSAVWDLAKAHQETTPTRARICLNGLWCWQPALEITETVPTDGWGYFKVPGPWPGITDYLQKDSQTLFMNPKWKQIKLSELTAAWYQRKISIPSDWIERRLALQIEYLHSYGVVFVDGRKVDEVRFPGGEVDLTSVSHPGREHILSMLVVAMPLKGVMLSYNDTASAREVKGSVARRGLCGDVFLTSAPSGPHIKDISINTSVRLGTIALDAALDGLATNDQYAMTVRVSRMGQTECEYRSGWFQANDISNGRFMFNQNWKPGKLWDLHTPENMHHLKVSLVNSANQVLDASWTIRFGFREFWINGRDFYLNGSRIFLSGVPLDNAQVGAAQATYQAAWESLKRLQSFGINLVYTHNYGCEPGTHLSFTEILKAADDAGMLVALSQPHFSHYDWRIPGADQANGYAHHAEFYVRQARNHPSVVFYSMSHNATGYSEDMNPDLIDGVQCPRDSWSLNNAKLALRAEAIVNRLDPTRIVYHHSSGNLGSMHTVNFYANFVPIQEQSDWFGPWATRGVKPVFTCEYSVPFTWDWTMYRGWYRGNREFGSAKVPWEFCLAEWNAQFFGAQAYKIREPEKKNLRWEAKQFSAGNLWHRWDYPFEVGSTQFDERYPVLAWYLNDNFRAFRTWGVSATSPWEYGHYWKLRPGFNRSRHEFKVDWDNLQRPGFSPDYLDECYERFDLAFEPSDWVPTEAAQALIRNNRPLLAYLSGKPSAFTSKGHNFHPGESFEKQIIILNNSRQPVNCQCQWSFNLPVPVSSSGKNIILPTGEQTQVPIVIQLPANLPTGSYDLTAAVRFDNSEVQRDSLAIHVMPRPMPLTMTQKIALFDPKGETRQELIEMGIQHQPVNASTDLSSFDILIVGKAALTISGPAPDIMRVREGLKVLIFEQTPDVLEKRFGFRIAEYGLRWVFKRVPSHPLLAGLTEEHLRNWRGESTIVPSRLSYEMRPRYGPTVKWCDIPVTRIWRCGNRGNVASVLIEKPAHGDFLPILDGGYSLQYSPLLEYHEGQGMVLFCQMDVSGRTETDPAATMMVHNIIDYMAMFKSSPCRQVVCSGGAEDQHYFASSDFAAKVYNGEQLSLEHVLVVGPSGGRKLASQSSAIAHWLAAGGHLLAIGLDDNEANSFLPFRITTMKSEHISAFFDTASQHSVFEGIAPAEVHNRDPRELDLVTAGALIMGNGILARADNANVVLCQLAPWKFANGKQGNLRRTYRRSAFLVRRLLANMGVSGSTPILNRFSQPVDSSKSEKRFLEGLYVDQPEEWDDPYRFFRW